MNNLLFTTISFFFELYFALLWYLEADWSVPSEYLQGPFFTLSFCLTIFNATIICGGDKYKRKMYESLWVWISLAFLYILGALGGFGWVTVNVL